MSSSRATAPCPTSNNLVEGNTIGTDPTGAVALGNGVDGVRVNDATGNLIGGTAAGAGNLISANTGAGVNIIGGGNGNTVQGNLIGTNSGGTVALANSSDGVAISAQAPRATPSAAPRRGQ